METDRWREIQTDEGNVQRQMDVKADILMGNSQTDNRIIRQVNRLTDKQIDTEM